MCIEKKGMWGGLFYLPRSIQLLTEVYHEEAIQERLALNHLALCRYLCIQYTY